MESTVIPIILIAAGIFAAYQFAGIYGIALAAVGMLSTTGITVETAAFVVLAVIPSTLEERVPSKDKIEVKIVKIIPKIHTIEDFKNFEIPSN